MPQPPGKSIPALVLILERSLTHILRIFKWIRLDVAWLPPACHSHPEKSIPAKVLKSERSLTHILRNFRCMRLLWRGCHRHLPATGKKYTGKSFKIWKVRGGFWEIQVCFGWSGMWLSPASPSHPKKYTGNSFNFGKVPNPYFEKFQVNLVGCSAAVVGTSQHPEKSIPAIVLKSERSLTHILRNFKWIWLAVARLW